MNVSINTVHRIDAIDGFKQLQDDSIDCIMTSPPYWSQRDYGIPARQWRDGQKSVLGLELTCEAYVEHLSEVFFEAHRVLKPSGTLWVNLADTYAGSWGNSGPARGAASKRVKDGASNWIRQGVLDHSVRLPSSRYKGAARKSLCLIPERFALAMANQGWILRNRIVWHKSNHMPSSVKDRFACSWEYLFLFAKSRKYAFDLDAVRVPHRTRQNPQRPLQKRADRTHPGIGGRRLPPRQGDEGGMHPLGRNPSDYWSIAPETRTQGAILGNSGAVSIPGGDGWTGHVPGGAARIVREGDPRWLPAKGKNPGDVLSVSTKPRRRRESGSSGERSVHRAAYPEALCVRPILAGCPRGGVVLDPFAGSGTTCVVAKRLGRGYLGFEINEEYVRQARIRIAREQAPESREQQQVKGGTERTGEGKSGNVTTGETDDRSNDS